ncbi:MAG TPA: NUDIX hydrolase [Candidatus Caenarcaniphilales bacterium]
MIDPPVQVALAILHQQGQFLLQLRDNIPGIVYPGCWGFFGGHLEGDESPEAGLRRELLEEINYVPPLLTGFRCYYDSRVVRHVYQGSLTVPVQDLVLREGWDLGLWTPAEIERGARYSPQANQVRSLAPPTYQILLDFLETDLGRAN